MNRRHGFLEPDRFPFVGELERSAASIREEFDRLEDEDGFRAWPERELYNAGWDVFGLYFFARVIPENCARCPRTAEALRCVPSVTTAGFSRLAPGTRIRPHVGRNDRVLRCHLALIVPPGCAIRVGSATRAWEEGRCLVFDDTMEHEAWNDSERDRVVLLVDFLRSPAAWDGA